MQTVPPPVTQHSSSGITNQTANADVLQQAHVGKKQRYENTRNYCLQLRVRTNNLAYPKRGYFFFKETNACRQSIRLRRCNTQ